MGKWWIKHPGRMTRECRRRGYSKMTFGCIQEVIRDAKKKHDTSLLRAALLGKRILRGEFRKGKK